MFNNPNPHNKDYQFLHKKLLNLLQKQQVNNNNYYLYLKLTINSE